MARPHARWLPDGSHRSMSRNAPTPLESPTDLEYRKRKKQTRETESMFRGRQLAEARIHKNSNLNLLFHQGWSAIAWVDEGVIAAWRACGHTTRDRLRHGVSRAAEAELGAL